MAFTKHQNELMTKSPKKAPGPRHEQSPGKVAITLRLEAVKARRLQAIAQHENRTLTNYVETVLLRDLMARDEADRVITVFAAPETSSRIDPGEVIRGEGETDAAYERRQAVAVELWSIPDNG